MAWESWVSNIFSLRRWRYFFREAWARLASRELSWDLDGWWTRWRPLPLWSRERWRKQLLRIARRSLWVPATRFGSKCFRRSTCFGRSRQLHCDGVSVIGEFEPVSDRLARARLEFDCRETYIKTKKQIRRSFITVNVVKPVWTD